MLAASTRRQRSHALGDGLSLIRGLTGISFARKIRLVTGELEEDIRFGWDRRHCVPPPSDRRLHCHWQPEDASSCQEWKGKMCLNISYVRPYKETMLSISLQDAPEDEHEDVPTTPADRLAFFTNAHNVLLNCQTFTGLVRKCVQLEEEVSRVDLDVSQHSIVSLRGTVDRMAFQLLPTDDPLPNHMPLVVGADGNCFPRSLSISCV